MHNTHKKLAQHTTQEKKEFIIFLPYFQKHFWHQHTTHKQTKNGANTTQRNKFGANTHFYACFFLGGSGRCCKVPYMSGDKRCHGIKDYHRGCTCIHNFLISTSLAKADCTIEIYTTLAFYQYMV